MHCNIIGWLLRSIQSSILHRLNNPWNQTPSCLRWMNKAADIHLTLRLHGQCYHSPGLNPINLKDIANFVIFVHSVPYGLCAQKLRSIKTFYFSLGTHTHSTPNHPWSLLQQHGNCVFLQLSIRVKFPSASSHYPRVGY